MEVIIGQRETLPNFTGKITHLRYLIDTWGVNQGEGVLRMEKDNNLANAPVNMTNGNTLNYQYKITIDASRQSNIFGNNYKVKPDVITLCYWKRFQ